MKDRTRKRFLVVKEVSNILQVHPQTTRGYIKKGKLVAFRPEGSRILRVSAEALMDFIRKSSLASTVDVDLDDSLTLPDD